MLVPSFGVVVASNASLAEWMKLGLNSVFQDFFFLAAIKLDKLLDCLD